MTNTQQQAPAGWVSAVEDWLTTLSSARCARGTLRTRRQSVLQFAREGDVDRPELVTQADLERWIGSGRWARETAYSHRAALRSFFGWAAHRGIVETDPAIGLPKIPRRAPAPRACPERSFVRAVDQADERVALMVRLAGDYGLRRAEIATLRGTDVVEDLTYWSLRIRGKGDRVRLIPLDEDDADIVDAIRSHGDAYVFPGKDEGHLSPWWVGELVGKVLPAGFTTHSLRHRFATATYVETKDLFAVQALLGHTSPATTVRYVQLPNEAGRAAVRAARDRRRKAV